MNIFRFLVLYSIATYVIDVPIRRAIAARRAREYANWIGKPMINIGAGTSESALFGPTLYGDINIDIASKSLHCGPNVVCYGDAENLSQYPDKFFGSLLASHVLEHLENPTRALEEWRRVSDQVFVIVPSWWAPHTWLHPDHKWFVSNNLREFRPLRIK
jgi:ubiquinone/menaquinone biosynthesis C-methylase UbiE